MQRIILLLFLIPLFFFLAFGFGLLIDLNLYYSESRYVYLFSYAVTLIIGIWSYSQLWKISRGVSSQLSQAALWIIVIISFSIVPIVFYISTSRQNAKNIVEEELYEQTHCKEVITKQHKYTVKVCDNDRVLGDSVSVSEYIRELGQ